MAMLLGLIVPVLGVGVTLPFGWGIMKLKMSYNNKKYNWERA